MDLNLSAVLANGQRSEGLQFFVLISNPKWISILVLCYQTNRFVKPTVLCAYFKPKMDLNLSAVLPNQQICEANSSLSLLQTQNGSQS